MREKWSKRMLKLPHERRLFGPLVGVAAAAAATNGGSMGGAGEEENGKKMSRETGRRGDGDAGRRDGETGRQLTWRTPARPAPTRSFYPNPPPPDLAVAFHTAAAADATGRRGDETGRRGDGEPQHAHRLPHNPAAAAAAAGPRLHL